MMVRRLQEESWTAMDSQGAEAQMNLENTKELELMMDIGANGWPLQQMQM